MEYEYVYEIIYNILDLKISNFFVVFVCFKHEEEYIRFNIYGHNTVMYGLNLFTRVVKP